MRYWCRHWLELHNMTFPRASGILLHITSLPGKYGIGDMGAEAYSFVNFLENAKQTYWQVLPLSPTGYGDSPYQCFSAFAGNTLLISPEELVADGLLNEDQIPEFHSEHGFDQVDYGAVYQFKNNVLKAAFDIFLTEQNLEIINDFHKFVDLNNWWLHDYALFRAIKAAHDNKPWYEWPDGLKLRDADALADAAKKYDDIAFAEKFDQFIFFRQWEKLKSYANEHGVKIIGDMPIFTALDSADVWCNQELFKLDSTGMPLVVAGVPPDYFSETGQLWGNPIYDWEKMLADGFRWWAAKTEFTLRLFDIVRIDHFRGFAATWEVPGQDETAENGQWVKVPGKELFTALKHYFGQPAVIAEDLGVMDDDVNELRDMFDLPGMRILQYGFGGDAKNRDLPHNYIPNSVVYTGTHDNETIIGWYYDRLEKTEDESELPAEIVHCREYLQTGGTDINWAMMRAAFASVADTAIIQMQDVLGLDNSARMNTPSTGSGNWQWRMNAESLTAELEEKLKYLTELFNRI